MFGFNASASPCDCPPPAGHNFAQLLHDWEVDTTDLRLFDWEIPGAGRLPADGFYLLNNLPPATELSAQERLGDDLVFWQVTSPIFGSGSAAEDAPDVAAGQKGGAKSLHARWRGPRRAARWATPGATASVHAAALPRRRIRRQP
ncbi:MAG: hypothetical protein R2873_35985 [Caldilineaceae bacterium]